MWIRRAWAAGVSTVAIGLAAAAAYAQLPADIEARAHAGDGHAQAVIGEAYLYGRGVKVDAKIARGWYEKAAAQNYPAAQRVLGEMYASGQGGKKDRKKAVKLWVAADKGGDPMAPILVADAYYTDITGEKTPKPGQFKFQGAVPVAQIDDAIAWYEEAEKNDPRPEVQARSKSALYVLRTLRSAGSSVQVKK